jgi:hypothetical protein
MAVLMPVAMVATLLTSGNPPVNHAQRLRTTIAALARIDDREHAEAIDVSLDRRLKLLESAAG